MSIYHLLVSFELNFTHIHTAPIITRTSRRSTSVKLRQSSITPDRISEMKRHSTRRMSMRPHCSSDLDEFIPPPKRPSPPEIVLNFDRILCIAAHLAPGSADFFCLRSTCRTLKSSLEFDIRFQAYPKNIIDLSVPFHHNLPCRYLPDLKIRGLYPTIPFCLNAAQFGNLHNLKYLLEVKKKEL